MISRVRIALLAVLFGCSALSAAAQVTGSIAGTVRDASGAVLPGVTVTLTGPALQRENEVTTTAADGSYRLPLVPPGVYELKFELSGFSPVTQGQVEVALNRQTTLDESLKVAGVSESVQVSEVLPVIEVTRSDMSSRVESRTIDALPLNGRNFVDLVALAPGARPVPEGQQGANVSIFGERGSAVSFLVDGAENNDPLDGGPALRYTQDSVREFEVVTTGYEAEFGRAQGGVVNVITRSGTNQVSGRGFWFRRSDALDSSNVPGQDSPKLSRNQWGGTAGGPIAKDRAFFFGSFERLDETRGVNLNRSVIPAWVQSGIATPSGTEDFSLGPKTGAYTLVGKADYNLNASNRLSITGNGNNQDVTGEISSPVAGTQALPSAAATTANKGWALIGRETATLGNSTFLESTVGYTHGRSGTNLEQTARSEPILLLLRSPGFLQTGAPFGGQTLREPDRLQLTQSLTHLMTGDHGSHQLKAGWDFNRVTLTGYNQVTNDVEYSAAFLAPNAGDIMANAFERLGFAQSVARFFTLSATPGGSLDLNMHSNATALYAQDRWDVGHGVTVDAGLRYDYDSLFGGDKNDFAPRLGVAWDINNQHNTIVKANWGLFYDRNLLSAAATVPEKGGIFTRSVFDVALPRLGSDYTDSLIDLVITSGFPTATPGVRTPAENPAYTGFANALRNDPLALYKLLGIAVADPSKPPVVTSDNIQQLSGKSAAQALALLESTYPGTDFEFFDVPGGSIVGNRVLSIFPRGPLSLSRDVSVYSEDKTPHTNAFNIGVDRQIGQTIGVSATYVHRRTRDLLTRRIINLFDVPPGDPNFGKTTDGGPRLNAVGYDGLVNYDGIVLAVKKQFSDRYQFGASYTGSRARDNLLTGNVGSGFSNNNHPEIDYGPSNQSVPHVFTGQGLFVVPFDIHLSGIAFWRSGSAFNPRGIVDTDGDGLVDQRDTTQPRNAFRTKAYADVDLRVEKQFGFGSGQTISVLLEGFNLFNRANVESVSNVSGPSFGTPTTFFPGREMQIGIRYFFGRQ
ncbi:MAG TPA: TonB-dependent receptor [Vicinamibacterales bacterium]|jgi:outer membrane receptor protein involved in Fe transport|nr:TonB-dependent receptor [Vicinamibacterales bacterium]